MSKILLRKFGHTGRILLALALTVSILAGLGLAGQGRVQAQGEEVVSIDPVDQEVSRGETFTVDVMIADAENLWGFEFNLSFNSALVEVEDVELGEAFWADSDRTPLVFTESVVGGTLNYVVISQPPDGDPEAAGPDGDGVLATVTLKAIGVGTSMLDLHGTAVFSGTQARTPTEEDGSVTSLLAMAIDPETSIVNPDDEFTVDVMIMGAENLWGFEFSLSFNPAVLEVEDVELGEDFWVDSDRTPLVFTESVVGDTLNYVVISQPPAGEPDAAGPDGDGVLATITFKALTTGQSDLHLHGLESFAGTVSETPVAMDGMVYIVEAGVSVLPQESSVSRCDVFEVDIVLGGDVTDVWAFDISLDWNADFFEVEKVELDPTFWAASDRTPVEFDKNVQEGTLNYVVISQPPDGEPDAPGPDAPGVLAVVTLRAIGVGESDLTLRDVLISESGVEVGPAALTHGTARSWPEADGFTFSTIDSPQVAGVPFMVTITAVDADGDPVQHFSGDVTLSDTTGTLSPTMVEFVDGEPAVTAEMMITQAHEGIIITAQGTNPCEEDIDGESNAFDVEPDVENPAAVTIDPAEVTLTAGDCVTFTLTGEDAYGNTFPATDDAIFTVDGGGEIDANEFCAETAGEWTVTGTYLDEFDEATVTVEPDFDNPIAVTIDPEEETLEIGECVTFTLMAEDAYGNEFDVTDDDDTTFTVDDVELDANEFCAETAGVFTVTGTYLTVPAEATVTVEEDVFYIFLPIVVNNYGP